MMELVLITSQASIAVRIWQSDDLIDNSLRDALLACVSKLEDVPDELKDWHPRANGQVLDLVHPSLYPVVYGRTIVSASSSPRETRQAPQPQYSVDPDSVELDYGGEFRLSSDYHAFAAINTAFLSQRFQWLPTDFAISEDGTSASALGYINNLEPNIHADSYSVIERLVARFVPLWERVLGETAAGYYPPARITGRYDKDYLRDATEEEDEEGIDPPSVITLPSLQGPFEEHLPPPVVELNGQTLQVIVKLANIHLVRIVFAEYW